MFWLRNKKIKSLFRSSCACPKFINFVFSCLFQLSYRYLVVALGLQLKYEKVRTNILSVFNPHRLSKTNLFMKNKILVEKYLRTLTVV